MLGARDGFQEHRGRFCLNARSRISRTRWQIQHRSAENQMRERTNALHHRACVRSEHPRPKSLVKNISKRIKPTRQLQKHRIINWQVSNFTFSLNFSRVRQNYATRYVVVFVRSNIEH